ncbi:type I DNA topoisomerase [Elusimicrobiota bacterium]
MGKTLIIVESPTKAKIIKKFLGKHYDVVSSMGHIRDLPVSRFGVDVQKGYEPQYEVIKGKKKVINDIKDMLKKTDKIYLAMDEDREGEAIGWHIIQSSDIDRDKHTVDRIVFHEITQEAIEDALMSPRKLDMNLVYAQQARRILDRIVGYRISPLISRKIRKGLSAGRVQSIGLKMIVEREKERESFKVKKYFTIEGTIEKDGKDIKVMLWGKDGKRFGKLYLDSAKNALQIISYIKDQLLTVTEVKEKKKKKRPLPPFITSTLQQEAYNSLGYNPERTMRIAQQLYEGIDLPDGTSSGLITYMRTDSVSVAQSAIVSVRKLIKDEYGNEYLPPKQVKYRAVKAAQEAHECIRPTDVSRLPDNLKNVLTADQYKLYNLIWMRFVACQMKAAEINNIDISFNCAGYDMRSTGHTLLFDGYMRVWPTKISEIILPELEIGMTFGWKEVLHIEHDTKPPARYTPATLVRELEKIGIGRPSTYATILRTLFLRKYIVSEKGALIPQEIGTVVSDTMGKHFQKLMSYEFTAEMEEKLDQIASGKQKWQHMIDAFYSRFDEQYENAVKNMKKIKDEETDMKCSSCGSKMVVKWGRNGKFLACSAFPKCKQAFSIDENGEIVQDKQTEMKCPECRAPMIIKTGRYGKFLACSQYPKCRKTLAVDNNGSIMQRPLGYEKCPKCGKETVIKSSRRGKFLACTGFPQCKFSRGLDKPADNSDKTN